MIHSDGGLIRQVKADEGFGVSAAGQASGCLGAAADPPFDLLNVRDL